jgi:hypothetical protein
LKTLAVLSHFLGNAKLKQVKIFRTQNYIHKEEKDITSKISKFLQTLGFLDIVWKQNFTERQSRFKVFSIFYKPPGKKIPRGIRSGRSY